MIFTRTALMSILCGIAFGAIAQEQTDAPSFYEVPYGIRNSGSFGKKSVFLTLCYGVPSRLHGEINGIQDPNRSVLGPIKLMLEFPIRDEVGIAPKFLYARGSWNHTDSWWGYIEMRTWAVATGATGYYHFNKLVPVKQLDLFAGVGFYVGLQKYIWDVSDPSNTDIKAIATPTISTGARYYLTPGFGVYAEAGITGGSFVDMGLTFRFQ
ncbi:MAG: hypothetical protein K8F30_03065 [Taibaiella sp.]|nr:hypothetical protein [Taibaiella sp.]